SPGRRSGWWPRASACSTSRWWSVPVSGSVAVPKEDERLRGLTPQEHRILALLSEGRTNRQIADEMYLAEKTVKNYVSNLLAKMGMSRRTEAAVYAAHLAGAVPPRALRVTNGSVAGRHGVPRSLHG
ncbi:MAG: response regulator transcription factor, partial [Microthrixaceae bacterium]